MKSKIGGFFKLRYLLSSRQAFASILGNQPLEAWQKLRVATCSTVSANQVEEVGEGTLAHANDSTEVFRRWGCTDNDIAQLFVRGPSLRRSDLNQLQDKLHLLQGLGITSPDLVKIINCRPRFLKCRINNNFHERIEFFLKMFESKEVLIKAIPRVLLSGKMEEMGLHLQIKGRSILRALRMTEKRFLKKFVNSQPKDVADELMEFYQSAKGIKRLAETSRKNCSRGFPF